MDTHRLTRRAFLAAATTTALAAAAPRVNAARVVPRKLSPNEKMNIAGIGVGGMGRGNVDACAVTENIVALCDVDSKYAGGALAAYPKARRHTDYRKMFDAEDGQIDAVVIATPDHTHAVIAMEAVRRGKHVYCQKPLTHSVAEARALTRAAREAGVQTQMGNQGHSSDAIRRCREWVQAGVIGPIREVHAWSDRPVGGDPWSDFPIMARPKEKPPVPDSLDWDLWLGPAKKRPYHPIYHPMSWRGFVDFGTGPLGDMGCHILDPAFWALDLGQPASVQATTTHYEPEISAETYPRACVVRYQFPARGDMPPVALTWYDGRLKPPVPDGLPADYDFGTNGALFIGEKGFIRHGSHGAGGVHLLPEAFAKEAPQPPESIPRIPQTDGAHERDWIRACKTGEPASSNFEYGGALTEMVLLGVVAIRLPDRRLEWDGAAGRVTNCKEAEELVNPPYRRGWSLEG
ncbi:MAG TPA: Gfo/Idh/MocA family oxidoreductase [Candidatus Hydrogenedentes bacterium]|nr:Gfo/Idh/MocA family oxidoreductase [Candidatus Hydrogenedentota bacterium]